MNRFLLISALFLLACFSAGAQMRILPKAKQDSIALTQQNRLWSSDFLYFDSLTFDAGRISENDAPFVAKMSFRNVGSEALLFGECKSSCSCLEARVEPSFVPADSLATVMLRYRQKGHTGVHPRYLELRLAEPVDSVVAVICFTSCVY